MKHIRFILTFILLLALPMLLCTASATEYTAPDLFTVRYDEKAYAMDSTTYSDENVDDAYHWFFILYNDTMMFDVSMEKIDGFEAFSTKGAAQSDLNAYLSDMLDQFSDDEIKLLTVVEAPESQVPFYIFSYESEDGPYLMAETVVNGYGIDFMAYYNDSDKPLDDHLTTALTELVSTYAPAGRAA